MLDQDSSPLIAPINIQQLPLSQSDTGCPSVRHRLSVSQTQVVRQSVTVATGSGSDLSHYTVTQAAQRYTITTIYFTATETLSTVLPQMTGVMMQYQSDQLVD